MLHWTGGWNNGVDSTIRTLMTRANPGSDGTYRLHYHIVVDGDGLPHQISDLRKKCNHGGGAINSKTLGISYQGGTDNCKPRGGNKTGDQTYTRTWEDWQKEKLKLCTRDDKSSRTFNAKKQWESLVDSILYMKLTHPQLK
jgi:hypothetical protein